MNLHWFLTLDDARRIIATWEEEYNTTRPHSALGNQPPAVYARRHMQRHDEADCHAQVAD